MELSRSQTLGLVGLAERLAVMFEGSNECCYPVKSQPSVVAVSFEGKPRAAHVIIETSEKVKKLLTVVWNDENVSYLEMVFPNQEVRDSFMNLYNERGVVYVEIKDSKSCRELFESGR
ncbi:MAG: hypothetical protein K6G36_00455 [Candidatus Saccharibacteria bacterium]|nr:hypothetical protein [Candidatus Saccharibacteria bacterium]